MNCAVNSLVCGGSGQRAGHVRCGSCGHSSQGHLSCGGLLGERGCESSVPLEASRIESRLACDAAEGYSSAGR